MKIGLVRRGFSETGGAEAYLRRFTRALMEGGHETVLFGSEEWRDADWPFGERQVVAGRSPGAFADALAAAMPKKACDYLFSLERVWSCDCYRAGDGVHREWLERRALHEPKWNTWFRGLRRKHRELLALERRLFTPAATPLVIANSNMVRDEIIRSFDYPAGQIRVIYNGAPTATPFSPEMRSRGRHELGLGESDYAVLFAGSGWERKGLRFAVEGINLAKTPGAVLLVAGRGDPGSMPHSARTRFLGPLREMQNVLAAADVFLLPTIYDPFSNACLEALAAGLPVITSRDNGFSEIITPGRDGDILREPDDVTGIAAAIDSWSDPAKRDEARPRLAALGAQFSIERNLRETLEALRL